MVKRFVGVLLMLSIATLVCNSPVLANGGKAKAFLLRGSFSAGDGFCTFVAQGDPVTFYLATLNNKYHIIAIRAASRANRALKLSKDDDTVEIRFESRTVKGILNLSSVDRQTWDGLSDKIRAEIAYPSTIPAGEEEGIYVYIPTGDLKNQKESLAVPDSITYAVKSVGEVVLAKPVAAR